MKSTLLTRRDGSLHWVSPLPQQADMAAPEAVAIWPLCWDRRICEGGWWQKADVFASWQLISEGAVRDGRGEIGLADWECVELVVLLCWLLGLMSLTMIPLTYCTFWRPSLQFHRALSNWRGKKRLPQNTDNLKWMCFSSYSNYSHTCQWSEFEVLYSDKDLPLFPVTLTMGTKHLTSSSLWRATLKPLKSVFSGFFHDAVCQMWGQDEKRHSSWLRLCDHTCFSTDWKHSRAPTCLYGSTRMSLLLSHFGLEGNVAINHLKPQRTKNTIKFYSGETEVEKRKLHYKY